MASRFDLVVFDFDGTLANSSAWFAGIFNDIADRFGFRALTAEQLHSLRGHSNREIIKQLGIPMWKMPFIARHMRQRVASDAESIPLFDGVSDLLRSLHGAGMTLAIVSSNSEANIRKILGQENANAIHHYGCGAGLFGKARLLRSVIKRSSTSAKATLCVGDETRDIEAARQVGAWAAAVGWGYASMGGLRRFNPDIVFESIDEIARYCLAPQSVHDASTRPNNTSRS